MNRSSKLTLECLAIGSLPHINLEKAMEIVKKDFSNIPFCPQLTKISKNEDMIYQFLENMPSFFLDENSGKMFLETESEKFFQDIEQFFIDYEICTAEKIMDNNEAQQIIEKYAISSNNSSAFPEFIKIIKEYKPNYAKGQIVGPFTLATTLVDKSGKCAFYDETLKEIIIKTLSLKALWQIYKIKSANPKTIPIIFIDEPSISQLGTSAYLTISQEDVIDMIKEISDLIKFNGALSAIHCCGKCNWDIPISANVNILNLDAYTFGKNLSLFSNSLNKFIINGGKIAWGIVPTLDVEELKKVNLEILIKKFNQAIKYLTEKGINEKILIENSLISPSCGAGALDENLAEKAMNLTKELSDSLKERFSI